MSLIFTVNCLLIFCYPSSITKPTQSIFKTVTSPIRHSSGIVPSDFPSTDIDGQPESNTSIFIKRKRGEKSSRKPIYQTRKRVRERKMPLCSRTMRNKSGTRLPSGDSWVHYSVRKATKKSSKEGGVIKQRLGVDRKK
ncbi:hypothetical protein CEXT_95991 [Caerostris extrusa]|uniref:Uncharacterized protein n=1 Tax=Caerostris extrusa TaxID=172846 RepID=A0AAV4W435_CAEEX|nr:hypothetical protein CEXT_95991 [Caerostris extrusa]